MPELETMNGAARPRMTAEHWGLMVVLLVMLASMEDAPTWAEVFRPKSVSKMAAAALIVARAAKVPPQ